MFQGNTVDSKVSSPHFLRHRRRISPICTKPTMLQSRNHCWHCALGERIANVAGHKPSLDVDFFPWWFVVPLLVPKQQLCNVRWCSRIVHLYGRGKHMKASLKKKCQRFQVRQVTPGSSSSSQSHQTAPCPSAFGSHWPSRSSTETCQTQVLCMTGSKRSRSHASLPAVAESRSLSYCRRVASNIPSDALRWKLRSDKNSLRQMTCWIGRFWMWTNAKSESYI